VLHEGSKDIRRVGWPRLHSELGMLIDPHLRTHVCTVAGLGRAVKHREPDAPKVGG
jgi:hypothetical protein